MMFDGLSLKKPMTPFIGMLLLSLMLSLTGCNSSDSELLAEPDPNPLPEPEPDNPVSFQFDFNTGDQGWIVDFADYPVGMDEFYKLESGWRQLPAPLDSLHGVFVSGSNHSDDLLMFIKTRVEGLQPNTRYALSFEIEFATNVATGCVGIGGSPGEGVYVKAGAVPFEPVPLIIASADPDGSYRLNIDSGNQSQGGSEAIVIGNVANTKTDCSDDEYELKTLTNGDHPFEQFADENGGLWLIFATDSGFEGTTSLYYTRARVEADAL